MENTTTSAPSEVQSPNEVVQSGEPSETMDLDALEAAEADAEAGSGQSDLNSEKGIDAAVKSGEISKKEAKELKKKLQIKIDGSQEEVEIDFNDDEALKRHLQKSKAFDKRAKEYAQLKNNVDVFVQNLLANDEAAEQMLRQVGMDPEDFAKKLLERKIKEMEKSPEQLEREKMQKELEELRSEKKRIQQEKEQAEMEKLRNQYAAEIENDIMSALDAENSKLPKNNPRVLKKIAQTMLSVLEMKDAQGNPLYPQVTAKDVIPVVEKEWREELRSYFDTSNEELIEELVGKQNIDRLRKKRLAARGQAPKATASSIKDTGMKQPKEEVKQKKSLKDFLRDE